MVGANLLERWLFHALIEVQRAAVTEATAPGWVEQMRRPAGNPFQPLIYPTRTYSGEGGNQHFRVGMAWGVDNPIRGSLFRQLSRIHHQDRVSDLIEDRNIMGDEDDAVDNP